MILPVLAPREDIWHNNMTMKTARILAAIAVLIVISDSAFAAGFALYETSARGVAMGGATMGRYNDASAVYANPALITGCENSALLFGVSLVNPGMDVELDTPAGNNTYTPEDQWFPPPFAYYVQKMTDSLWLGIGIYTPFGLGVKHATDWPGRFSSVETKIDTFNINPNVAWKVNDRLSLAAGIDVMYFDITLKRNVPVIDRLLDIKADSWGAGGNLAVSYLLTDDLGVGLTYRSEIVQEVEGDAKIAGMPGKYDAWEDLTLPQSISFGINYTGVDKWNFGLITTWTGWSSYDNLTIHFKQPLLGRVDEFGADKRWNDVWRFGAGAEYQFSDQSFIEFGYVYDSDPVNLDYADYLLPAGDRNIISLGLRTLLTDNWELGVAFSKIFVSDETVNARINDGVYQTKFKNGDAKVYSFQLSRKF